jgi:Sec-independent protein secretion pathway component TatC
MLLIFELSVIISSIVYKRKMKNEQLS